MCGVLLDALCLENPLRVHPRMCGVLCMASQKTRETIGSSPHVRGFVGCKTLLEIVVGFIPACAGFCILMFFIFFLGVVHPRMCGVLKFSWSKCG